MTGWTDLTADEREAATYRAFGWLSSAVGSCRLREEAWKADAYGSEDVAQALLSMAELLERAP